MKNQMDPDTEPRDETESHIGTNLATMGANIDQNHKCSNAFARPDSLGGGEPC